MKYYIYRGRPENLIEAHEGPVLLTWWIIWSFFVFKLFSPYHDKAHVRVYLLRKDA